METGNGSDQYDNISVSFEPQYVMDCYGTDQKAVRYDGNIVSVDYKQNSEHFF